MTPLEQMDEALTDEALDDAFSEALVMCSDTEPSTTLRHYILTALRPLLEQQAAAVATLTAERDEAREIAKRWHAHAADGRTGHGNYWPEERKKIAAWSGETR